MPWKEASIMTQRHMFLELYRRNEDTISNLAREFGISRKTAYKWIERHKNYGLEGLIEKSRKPHTTLNTTSIEKEIKILEAREKFPAWGARKLKKYLENQGHKNLPCESTK